MMYGRQGGTSQIMNIRGQLALPVLLGGIRFPPGATAGLPSSAILDRRQLFDFSPLPPQSVPNLIELFYAPIPCPATPCKAIQNYFLEKSRSILYIHTYR
jgi:hypothetical protein